MHVSLNVQVTGQGSGQAHSGDVSAVAQAGNTTVTASTSASAIPTASGNPPATRTVSPTAAGRTSIVIRNRAQATSGNASAIGVIASTIISGDQAVVIHVPAHTSGRSVTVNLDASVSNTGVAVSQSGSVNATGVQGNLAIGSESPTAAPTSTPAAGAAATPAAIHKVDVRGTNYALADSGDALAIGVQASTIIHGVQRVTVIVDDNSSGNRIIVNFHVRVQNEGQATASSGSTAASGQQGTVAVGAGGAIGAAQVLAKNSAEAMSGSSSALGVDATTLVDALQSATLVVGEDSSNNQLLESFDVAVSNTGIALAASGTSQAVGLAGNETVGSAALGSRAGTAVVTDRSSLSDTARGRSGDASAVGLAAASSIQIAQGVRLTLNPSSAVPLSIRDGERVVNVGLANAITGSADVTALRIPVATPTPLATGPPGTAPSPAPRSLAELPLPLPSSSPIPSATPVASAAAPSVTPVPRTPVLAPHLAQATQPTSPANSGRSSARLAAAGRRGGSAANPPRPLLLPGGSLVLHEDAVGAAGHSGAYETAAPKQHPGDGLPYPAGVLAAGFLPLALSVARKARRR